MPSSAIRTRRRGGAAALFALLAAAHAPLSAQDAAADRRAAVEEGAAAWTRGDYPAAIAQWRAPAAAGDADANFNLGQAYRLGLGVAADSRAAEPFYARAAALGHAQAADIYGAILYQTGRKAEGLPYLQTAVTRGDPRALYLLGIAHFNGDGVARDWPRAHAMLALAAEGGIPQAAAALEQIDSYLSPQDRAAALRLQTEFAPAPSPARAEPVAAANTANRRAATALPRPAPAPAPAKIAAGPWTVRLGAFGVAANADRLVAALARHPALAGHAPVAERAGKLTLVQAAGFATRADARRACAALVRGGHACLVAP